MTHPSLLDFSKGLFIATALFAGINIQTQAQSISINTTGANGPSLFNVGNSNPFQITANGQVLGQSAGTLSLPSYSFVGNTNTGMFSPGANNLSFSTNGAERLRISPTGLVGIGTGSTTPAYNLELNGSFGFGNGTLGTYRSRTETRDNAGLSGNTAQSGFFETSSPTNYPTGASGSWHLIDVRNSNTGVNNALQIAGSATDQRLFFRKTNNSATTAWSEIQTRNSNTNDLWVISGTFAASPDDITAVSTITTDDGNTLYSLGFNFVYEGVSYPYIIASANGWVSFVTSNTATLGSAYTNNALPTSTFSTPTIFAYWDDLQPANSNVRILTQGTSPNRAVIIDTEGYVRPTTSHTVRFQVTIHEGSNLINVRYRDEMNHAANGQSATIGFQGAGGATAKAWPIIYNGKILDDNREDSGWSISPAR